MIEEKDVLNISFYEYKVAFTGSFKGMRYRIAREPFEHVWYLPPEKKEGAKLKLSVWIEPYSYDDTAKEEIEDSFFEYSNEGLRKIVEYLNHIYKERFSR